MFRNKHVIAALLIAPILSVMTYFAVDYAVSEQPHKALIGHAYALVEKPNCRYESGVCGLKNGDFQVELTAEPVGKGKLELRLSSVYPIESAGVAIVEHADAEKAPIPMASSANSTTEWVATLSYDEHTPTDTQRLRLALSANDTFYYAESSLAFIHYETVYQKDFR